MYLSGRKKVFYHKTESEYLIPKGKKSLYFVLHEEH
tara:strand:- start:16633 stop:16740 length:108 start_codon:yes stop_codon:yes gene_type:complete